MTRLERLQVEAQTLLRLTNSLGIVLSRAVIQGKALDYSDALRVLQGQISQVQDEITEATS